VFIQEMVLGEVTGEIVVIGSTSCSVLSERAAAQLENEGTYR
jgi:hypothetical protein